jgi:hypothetical protein
MTDGADLTLDLAKLDRDSDRLIRGYLTAGTEAVASATKGLERKLEAATQGAVPGRLWRAWASRTRPDHGPSRNPVGTVYVNGGVRARGAIKFWTQPGEVRGRRGQFLAVPLPAAGSRGRQRDLTPAEWEARHGVKLRFVARRGRAALLVVDAAVLSGRRQTARPNSARRVAAGRGSATVPIFVLLPMVKFRNAVAVEPMVKASERELVTDFLTGAGRVS